ncbi:MAG: nucleotidyltransferase domain-containing protein [Ignavibacteriaceae bacterium]|nr:nucleotidyltransferase domain-containing protein [Ignavibacteriaceae bacterium]
MVNSKIRAIVKRYLADLVGEGITVSKAFIYGSQANGTAAEDSDIDLMVISPLFDRKSNKYSSTLWLSARKISYKIEPVGVGEKRFLADDYSPLIQLVKQEGIEITI